MFGGIVVDMTFPQEKTVEAPEGGQVPCDGSGAETRLVRRKYHEIGLLKVKTLDIGGNNYPAPDFGRHEKIGRISHRAHALAGVNRESAAVARTFFRFCLRNRLS